METREIIGNTTATPNPRPDWNQTDTTKADYILNKPEVLTEDEIIKIIRAYEANPYKLSGVWTFNANVTVTFSNEFEVNFSSNGTAYKRIKTNFKGYFYYIDVDGAYTLVYSDSAWKDETYRTVDFGITPQMVSKEFYEWFTANATSTTTDETGLKSYVTKSEFNDYVKTALTTNAIELTEEEKAAVCNWIGAALDSSTMGHFTVKHETITIRYDFVIGMTWEDFVNSDYCDGSISIYEYHSKGNVEFQVVWADDTKRIADINFRYEYADYKIINGMEYAVEY